MTRPYASLKSRLAARERLRVEKPGLLETAVALILAPGKRGPEALLIRRAERADDPWSGHAALPGGRREAGDRDRLAVAVRETDEEVGVALGAESLLGALDDLHPNTPSIPPLVISPFVFGLAERPKTRLSDEVAETFWVPLADLPACAGSAEVRVRERQFRVPCFKPGGLVVWGLTYRILSGFLPLL
ncbi:MAG: CoA pyrophosphatase [Elusimicrobia bacterium]|nr:CoA pyrophosphatase [Elusimicrobiota bacterium]